jgi:hypothetical protein
MKISIANIQWSRSDKSVTDLENNKYPNRFMITLDESIRSMSISEINKIVKNFINAYEQCAQCKVEQFTWNIVGQKYHMPNP